MKIIDAQYLTSVVDSRKLIDDEISEFAFVGRSNVGKSSIINNLVNKKGLAKTSSNPGHTRMINYFNINDGQFRFVDLPGYGFHKAGKGNEKMWSTLIERYLLHSQCLKLVFLLVDIRHEPSELDQMMIRYLIETGRNFVVVATKADKLSKAQQGIMKQKIASKLKIIPEMVVMHSSQTSQGRDEILNHIELLID